MSGSGAEKVATNSQRFFGLDVLRFAAVTLVLHIHAVIGFDLFSSPISQAHFTDYLFLILPPGNNGVDLFFVLSGFLVSGLLFTEYAKCGTMSLGRFFVRRAFKIYPAFWVFIGATLVLRYRYAGIIDTGGLCSELFFVQNYIPGLWGHTWSLAVEEHFYLLLIGILFALKAVARRNERMDIHLVPRVYDAVLIVCVAARIRNWWWVPLSPSEYLHCSVWATHVRVDALFFGMLLAYWWHFRWDERVKARLMSCKYLFLVLGLFLISSIIPRFVNSDVTQVFGYPFIYLGAGCLLLAALSLKFSSGAGIFRWMAWLGRHSYSVYLWHMLVLDVLKPYLQTKNSSFGTRVEMEMLYHVASWVCGILTARIIEFPALRLRDKMFPSR